MNILTNPKALVAYHVIINILLIAGGLNWLHIAITGEDFLIKHLGLEYARYTYSAVGAAAVLKAIYQIGWLIKKRA